MLNDSSMAALSSITFEDTPSTALVIVPLIAEAVEEEVPPAPVCTTASLATYGARLVADGGRLEMKAIAACLLDQHVHGNMVRMAENLKGASFARKSRVVAEKLVALDIMSIEWSINAAKPNEQGDITVSCIVKAIVESLVAWAKACKCEGANNIGKYLDKILRNEVTLQGQETAEAKEKRLAKEAAAAAEKEAIEAEAAEKEVKSYASLVDLIADKGPALSMNELVQVKALIDGFILAAQAQIDMVMQKAA